MKQIILSLFLIFWVGMQSSEAQKKEFSERITKEVGLENVPTNTLIIRNFFGSISVEGYSGNQVLVNVKRTIWADSATDLELGKKELQLKVIQESDRVVLRPDAPYIQFDDEKLSFNWCNNEEVPYDHQLDFTIKVPNSVKIMVSGVNDGDVVVKNTKGTYLKAANVNGGITLTNVTGKTKVNCINGPVTISYADNPTEASEYYSLNGDINISYQKSLSANISFKSMNGDMFTDFDINKQFVKTNKESSKGNKPKYRYESKPVVQIGNGNIDFDFETLNGDVYIKKI
ncbi:DUF4097 family beta strand repeat-containing protein [Flagellimonas allohymeniacidonis]|nr:DUF4097 family beta strand repeat-containing protein [Allomuricauda hymeniacidonis]